MDRTLLPRKRSRPLEELSAKIKKSKKIKATSSKRYATHPKLVFGLKCPQHRTATMQHIAKYYQERVGVRASKDRLLTILSKLQMKIPEEEAKAIEEWLKSDSDSATKLKAIIDDVRGILRECTVCFENLPVADFPEQKITTACNHDPTTCRTCLSTSITTQIPDSAWDQISCPECPEPLPYDAVRTWASAEAFELYDKKSLLAAFRDIPGFTMCLAPNCGAGQIHEGGDGEPIMTCTTCSFKTCFTHKMPWHAGQTCSEYDALRRERMEQEAASEALIAEVAKVCPNPQCGHGIIKQGGCDHMTCRQCQYQFCWLCSAPYTNIRRYGNTAHEETCMHHTRNIARLQEEQLAARQAVQSVANQVAIPAATSAT